MAGSSPVLAVLGVFFVAVSIVALWPTFAAPILQGVLAIGCLLLAFSRWLLDYLFILAEHQVLPSI